MFPKFQKRRDAALSSAAPSLNRRATDTAQLNVDVVEDDSAEAWQTWQEAVARQSAAAEIENTAPALLEEKKNET